MPGYTVRTSDDGSQTFDRGVIDREAVIDATGLDFLGCHVQGCPCWKI